MEIRTLTLTADGLLDWINTLPGEKKTQVLEFFNEAKGSGGLFLDGIEDVENQLCLTVLIYCGRSLHETQALLFTAPCTPEGRDELEETCKLLTAGGISK